MHLDLYYTLCI